MLKYALSLFAPAMLASAASAAEIAVVNPGFEARADAQHPVPGWSLSQHTGPLAYEYKVDPRVRAQGKASLRVTRMRNEVYGLVSQRVAIAPASTARTLELSAQMRTRGVDGDGWVLMMTVIAPTGNEQVRAEPMRGNHEFGRVRLSAKLPAGAREVDIGALMLGGGSAWLDDVHLRTIE